MIIYELLYNEILKNVLGFCHIQGFGEHYCRSLRSFLRWEDRGVDGRIMLGWILEEVGCGCEDWIGLAEDRDRWRALVSAARNLRVP
jgi:hypothetical protein